MAGLLIHSANIGKIMSLEVDLHCAISPHRLSNKYKEFRSDLALTS